MSFLLVKVQNPCNISNGGCDQVCKTNATGFSFCSCKVGFVLAQDGKSCEGKRLKKSRQISREITFELD